MNFGLYLLAIFLPPLYFLIRGRIGMAILHGILFVMSFFFIITIVLIPLAIICWIVCAVHALWNVRRQLLAEAAEELATKMAEKMRAAPLSINQPSPSNVPPSGV